MPSATAATTTCRPTAAPATTTATAAEAATAAAAAAHHRDYRSSRPRPRRRLDGRRHRHRWHAGNRIPMNAPMNAAPLQAIPLDASHPTVRSEQRVPAARRSTVHC